MLYILLYLLIYNKHNVVKLPHLVQLSPLAGWFSPSEHSITILYQEKPLCRQYTDDQSSATLCRRKNLLSMKFKCFHQRWFPIRKTYRSQFLAAGAMIRQRNYYFFSHKFISLHFGTIEIKRYPCFSEKCARN